MITCCTCNTLFCRAAICSVFIWSASDCTSLTLAWLRTCLARWANCIVLRVSAACSAACVVKGILSADGSVCSASGCMTDAQPVCKR